MSVWMLLQDAPAIAIFAHVLCAASLACAAGYGQRSAPLAWTAAVWGLTVPLVGPLGLCLQLLPELRRTHVLREQGLLELELARPLLMPLPEAASASLRDLLSDASPDPSARRAALISLRNSELSRAAPLLRMTLLDPDEDLRLLAFSMLEHREKRLRARIESGKQALLADDETARVATLAMLCYDHWQLVAGRFVSGELAARALDVAQDYGERVLSEHEDGAVCVLLARICLRAHDADRARAYLRRAERLGCARSVLAPLFAQTAFLQGRYAEIGRLLTVSESALVARPDERSARALWARWEAV